MGKVIGPEVRAVFFDAVGTLIHPDPPAAVAYAAVGQRFGSRLGEMEIRQRFRDAFQREEAADRAAGLQTGEAREHERWRRIVTEVLDDVADCEACFRELFEHFARPDAWRCDPETGAVVGVLRERGYRLGIASNYDHRLRRVVAGWPELTGIQPLVISSEVGWRKPAAEFFAAMCRAVELPAAQVLYVGDDVANDYEGARGAGLAAVLLDPLAKSATGGRTWIPRLVELV